MMTGFKKSKKGITLVESVLAVVILSILTIGVLTLLTAGGVKIDLTQCNGCGLCINVCPFDAIVKED